MMNIKVIFDYDLNDKDILKAYGSTLYNCGSFEKDLFFEYVSCYINIADYFLSEETKNKIINRLRGLLVKTSQEL